MNRRILMNFINKIRSSDLMKIKYHIIFLISILIVIIEIYIYVFNIGLVIFQKDSLIPYMVLFSQQIDVI